LWPDFQGDGLPKKKKGIEENKIWPGGEGCRKRKKSVAQKIPVGFLASSKKKERDNVQPQKSDKRGDRTSEIWTENDTYTIIVPT